AAGNFDLAEGDGATARATQRAREQSWARHVPVLVLRRLGDEDRVLEGYRTNDDQNAVPRGYVNLSFGGEAARVVWRQELEGVAAHRHLIDLTEPFHLPAIDLHRAATCARDADRNPTRGIRRAFSHRGVNGR